MKPKVEESKPCPKDQSDLPTHKTAQIFKKFGKCVLSPGIFLTKSSSTEKQEQSLSNHEILTTKPSSNSPPTTTSPTSKSVDDSGPSPLRQLLPVTLCIISFATVMSILIIYIDTTGKSDFS